MLNSFCAAFRVRGCSAQQVVERDDLLEVKTSDGRNVQVYTDTTAL